jgi:hypothetical protein
MFECDPSKDRSGEYWWDGLTFGVVIGFALGLLASVVFA